MNKLIQKIKNLSLITSITGIVGIIFTIAVIILIITLSGIISERYIKAEFEKLKLIGKNLSLVCSTPLQYYSVEELNKIIKTTLKENKGIYQINIIDTENTYIASTKESLIGKESKIKVESIKKYKIIKKGGKCILITPVYISEKEIGGIIEIKYTLKYIKRKILTLILIIAIVTFLYEIIALIGVYFVLKKSIIQPLFYITEKVQKVAEGQLEQEPVEVEAGGKNEIGILARAFEKMRVELIEKIDAINSQREYLNKRVDELNNKLKEIAKGNLSIKVEAREDDIPQIKEIIGALNEIIEAFKRIIINIKQVSSEIKSSSEEVSASTEEMRNIAEHQKDITSQAMATITELTATIKQISHNANETSNRIADNISEVEKTQQVLNNSMQNVIEISKILYNTIENMLKLAEIAERISEIVQMINGISEKSDLLALNAAIEATEAGVAGRRFRIVADEMRRLADLTLKRSKEIEEILKTIKGGIDESSEVLKQIGERFRDIEENMKNSVNFMESVRHIFTTTSDGMKEISISTAQQAKATESFSDVMKDIMSGAEQTARAIKETEYAITRFIEMSSELKKQIDLFKTE